MRVVSSVLAACAVASLAVAVSAALPAACMDGGSNGTAIAGCTPLYNDTVLATMTVAPGEYRNFHWVVGNYLDMDDGAGNRRSVTFEVRPCSGSAHLFVRALAKPFPTAESHDYASAKDGQPNSVTLQLLRAHFYISVLGVGSSGASGFTQATPADPISFSIIAKVSGGECGTMIGKHCSWSLLPLGLAWRRRRRAVARAVNSAMQKRLIARRKLSPPCRPVDFPPPTCAPCRPVQERDTPSLVRMAPWR